MNHEPLNDPSAVNPEEVGRVVTSSKVDGFLSERVGFWVSTVEAEGPPVRVDVPALLQRLRSP